MSDDLRERFERLRREDQNRTPSFQATVAAARRGRAAYPTGRFRLIVGATAVAAVAAALALGVALLRAPAPPLGVSLATTRWRGPTDFLLRLPGADLLRALPKVGASHTDWRAL